ncbi:flagellar export protein FliJ [Fredinandcohnia quinoae]|uniref:Flagellar FliJ protein n=1 Tax=Fredinandcohnia quinoae TaxID=2918902 RepID=A0AAW5DTS0_9BACI|nr:flagellar export protein FliJ [Fredinandcohnia sp. SECRCQ15]MCH1623783.1 flagellar biosynthesis chaperone FliJ [Fredinandcohnia sp. SECRCQ15]
MSYQFKFQKILTIKENEKNQVLADYKESVKEFENVAQGLYDSLKKKETLEEHQREELTNGLSIDDIRSQQYFISSLEKTINYYQQLVVKSRNKMQKLQAILTEKNIEVKKYEKISERDFANHVQTINAFENHFMDEISIQQYMNKGI